MPRKQYIVMWTRRPNGLASTREDYDKVFRPNRRIERVVVSRPGYEDVVAGNIIPTEYGAITFDGITQWFREKGWLQGRHYLPFAVTYDGQNAELKYIYIGD